MLTWLFILSFVLWSENVFAGDTGQDDIVVTDTSYGMKMTSIPSSAVVITDQDIKARHLSTVYDVLKGLPGIDIVRQGGIGKETSIFIRGAESSHTLVLIDGVSVNNPATGGFNLSDLPADNIERIEVVYGPLSPLYGSDAIGGVIQIFTKRALVSSGTIGFETGSFGTTREHVSATVKKDAYGLTLAASTLDTEGFSAVRSGSEKDGYQNTYISSILGIQLGALTRIDITAHLAETENELDNIDLDDPNYEQHRRWNMVGLNYSSSFTNIWTQKITLSRSNDQLVDLDENTDSNRSFANMNVKTIGWHHNVRSTDGNILTMGYEWQEKEAELKASYSRSFSNNVVYLQESRVVSSSANLITSLRWDKSTINEGIFSYRFGIAYQPVENVTWRFKYGTGFKFPNIEDLFNNDLKPEKSQGWEAGVEEFISDNFFISLTYYVNDFTDLIASDENSKTRNIGESTSKGVETNIDWNLSSALHLNGNYTYNETEDTKTNAYLLRMPLNKYGATFTIKPSGRSIFDIRYLHTGKRFDIASDGNGKPEILKAYSKVDIFASYKLRQDTELYGRIENLFDREYEDAKGYGAAGFTTYWGIKLSL